ncbi:MAG: DNA polymerase I [Mangrovibacterium sp.]
MSNNTAKRLFLIDAYALIYRSYFAFIRAPRFNANGLNTSAMLGFVNSLEQLLQKEKPSHLAVVFDVHAPTFRHEMYAQYKATRDEMPEDLRTSIPWVRQIIEAYNIPIIEKQGFEADDVIGTLSVKAEKEGYDVFMMTPDKDYAQLVTDKVKMYKPGRAGKETEIWGVSEVLNAFEIQRPEQVIDILGLMGDASDNIPGCPGVGEKTAQKLIAHYGSIDAIYENIGELKGKQKQNLEESEEQVRLSRKLAVIVKDVPVEFNEQELKMEEPNLGKLYQIFTELEFRTLAQKYEVHVEQTKPVQGDLFAALAESEDEELNTNYASLETTKHSYILIENAMQRASLRAELSVQKEFSFAIGTSSNDALNAELVYLSFAFKAGEAYMLMLPSEKELTKQILQEFALIFADQNITKITPNAKYALLVLRAYGLSIEKPIYDIQIAHYLINPDLQHKLNYLTEVYLNYKKITLESLLGKAGKDQLAMRNLAPSELCNFACEVADCTWQVKQVLDEKMKEAMVLDLFFQIEMPLMEVLASMEWEGMTLNTSGLNDYAVVLKKQIRTLEHTIINLADEQFNLSSPKQLGIILFEKLQIDSQVKKTKTKQYSTSEEVLSKLVDKHPIVPMVLEFRGLKKLLSTYVEALPLLVNRETGKLHSTFNQTVTATGRLSSTNPNLQNIPIRDDSGREIRKAFTASDAQHLFLSADYSQIELRIMAALSGDEHMLDAFRKGQDIHAATAAKIYKVPVEEVTSDMRRKAKTANFGIIYGISSFGLAQRLNIPRKEAKELIDGYFENFPRIKEYMDESIEKARKQGYVETIKGRRRYLSDINSANAVVRGIAERNAINAPIQGSAADIIKVAMVNIHQEMQAKELKSKMTLQVHDELNFDVLESELEIMKNIVKENMESAVNIGLPLLVEMQAASNWLDAH